MSEIRSDSGAAVTPEDPQRQPELPAELAEVFESQRASWAETVNDYQGSDAVARHAEAACDALDRVERALVAALSDSQLLADLLTSQGYEHETQLRPTRGVVSETRDAYVGPWTPIGPEKGANE